MQPNQVNHKIYINYRLAFTRSNRLHSYFLWSY